MKYLDLFHSDSGYGSYGGFASAPTTPCQKSPNGVRVFPPAMPPPATHLSPALASVPRNSCITCPQCHRSLILDDRGLRGFPKNRVLEGVIDRYQQSKAAALKCQLCEKAPKEATVMCESAHRPSRARSQHRAGAGREGELPGLEPVERRWPFSPWGLSAGKTTSRAARALPAALRRGRGCPRTKLHPGRPRQRQTTLRPDPAGPCISRFACNTSPSLEFLQKD